MRLFEGTAFDIPPKCDRCHKLDAECNCPPLPQPTMSPEKQTARIAVEKRKRGAVVTVIRDLADDASLPPLLTHLKAACGAGGTLKQGVLEIQGDHHDRVQALLLELKYRVKS